MRFVCISDIHGYHERLRLPAGDVLLVAGDFTSRGTVAQVASFDAWLGRQSFAHRIVIAGNHDFLFEQQPGLARGLLANATYLEDSGCVVGGLVVWGSPWQPEFFDWAFNIRRGELHRYWDRIPQGVDVLLTHGPPWRIMDRTADGREVGCTELTDALRRVRPRLHVFGHIHEGRTPSGVVERDGTTYVNASICTLQYAPTQSPVVVDLEPINPG